MNWQLIVLLKIMFIDTVAFALIKRTADLPTKVSSQMRVYVWCFLFSVIFFLAAHAQLTFSMAIIFLLGIFNSIAVLCQWNAFKISLSKTSAFTGLESVLAISLAYLLLRETQFLNAGIILGIAFILIAAVLLIKFHPKPTNKENGSSYPLSIFGWIAAFSIIWGIIGFLMRYYAVEGVTIPQFLASWYGGTAVGSIFLFLKSQDRKYLRQTKNAKLVLLTGIVVWLSMIFSYWSVRLAPLTVVEPIYLISSRVTPLLRGLFIFKEVKELTKTETYSLLLALLGGFFIGFSF